MKIGIFADSHYSSMEISNVTRRPSLSIGKIREAIAAFSDVDCIICLGDLVDTCDTYRQSEDKLIEVGELIRSAGKETYCLRGNHDCDIFTSEQFYAALGLQKPPFKVKKGKDLFIFMDANFDCSDGAYVPGKVDWTDTKIPEDQIRQLADALEDREAERVFVFMHQNIDPDVQWQHIVANADKVREMLAASGKDVSVIQGHYHPGHENMIDGVRYHTLPAMCEGERNHYEIMEI